MRPLTIGWARQERPWATCPLTENGIIRVVGHPRYPNSARSPAAVAPFVARLRTLPGHVFWKDELSLIGSELVDVDQIVTPGQVTDTYLLAWLRPTKASSRPLTGAYRQRPSAAAEPRCMSSMAARTIPQPNSFQ
jgi:hypothetical protein